MITGVVTAVAAAVVIAVVIAPTARNDENETTAAMTNYSYFSTNLFSVDG